MSVKRLNIAGLIFTLVGSATSAWGVFISPKDAQAMTGAAIGTNLQMNAMLVHQSQLAAIGLAMIAFGTVLQLLAQYED